MAHFHKFDNLQDLEVRDLVRAAQAGDQLAFGELFRRFQRQVMAVALRRLGNHAEAEELCQDVFIRALQKLDQLHEAQAFGGWLRTITLRMAVNRLVRRDPDVTVENETLEATGQEEETPLDRLLASERKTQVRRGLARLGKLDRETLVAFYVRGRSLVEMSHQFDAPIGTIKRRLHVARKRLARQVEELVAV